MTFLIGTVVGFVIIMVAMMTGPGRKFRSAFAAQFNKAANKVRALDPIAQMVYEADQKAEQLKDGRIGLEKHRGLLERAKHEEEDARAHVLDLRAKVKSYLDAGNRETAGQLVLELEKADATLAKRSERVKVHQATYDNNLEKLKYATRQVRELRERVEAKDADLRFSRVDKEIAQLGEALNFDMASSSNLGEIERVIQNEIDANNAAVQVAADMSGTGLEQIHRDITVEKNRGELALQAFEKSMT